MPSPLPPAEIEYELAHINQNRGPDMIVSSVICIALASVAVFLRFFARRLSRTQLWFDDYMMVLALVRKFIFGRGLFIQ